MLTRLLRCVGRVIRDRRGQGLVEIALALPIFLGLVFGTISYIWAFEAKVVVTNAARAAARYISIACDPQAPGYDPNWAANAQALAGQTLKDGALYVRMPMHPPSYPNPWVFPPGQPAGTWSAYVSCQGGVAAATVEYEQTNLFPPLAVFLGQSGLRATTFALEVTAQFPTE